MTTAIERHHMRDDLTLRDRRRAILRLALGTVQVFGAGASVVLLFLTGVNRWSLIAVVLTCAFTTVSVLLFGDRTRQGRKRPGDGE